MSSTTQTRPAAAPPDLAAIKQRQQATWSAGDYAVIGITLQIVGETLCETMDISPGMHVLDVAAGNGNATLAAARRGAMVTSTDYVPALLECGRTRAAADRLDVAFQVADAEALPFPDTSFDAVMSTFGVMFTPDQDKAAAELMRVCRKGGRIGMANWTPDGFIGQLFKTLAAHVPPAPGMKSPALWGTEERLAELFSGASSIAATVRQFVFRQHSSGEWLDVFRTYYGPLNRAFAALPEDGQAALERDVLALLERFNTGKGRLRIPGNYLEVVVTR